MKRNRGRRKMKHIINKTNTIWLGKNTIVNSKACRNICMVDPNILDEDSFLNFIMRNMSQENKSLVIFDENRKILEKTKEKLKKEKYMIKVVDLYHPDQSDHWNPIISFQEELDLNILARYIMESQCDEEAMKNDRFFYESEKTLLAALMYYISEEYPKSGQNFVTLIKILCRFEHDPSELYQIYEKFKEENLNSYFVDFFKLFRRMASEKTVKSIMTSLIIKLAPFARKGITSLIESDDLCLKKIRDKKTAMFIEVSKNDQLYDSYIGVLLLQVLNVIVPFYEMDTNLTKKYPVRIFFSASTMKNHPKILTHEMIGYLTSMNFYRVDCACMTNRLNDVKETFEKIGADTFNEWYFNTFIFYGSRFMKYDIKDNYDLYKNAFRRYESKSGDAKEELLKLNDLPEGKCEILIDDHEVIIDDIL